MTARRVMGRKPGRLAAARIAGKDPLLNTKGGYLSQVAMDPERHSTHCIGYQTY